MSNTGESLLPPLTFSRSELTSESEGSSSGSSRGPEDVLGSVKPQGGFSP